MVLAEGTAQCEQAGVVDGRQFEDCVLDWALTRNSAFVEAAAAHVMPVTEAGARTVGSDGTVAENFGVAVAPNFSSPRYGSDTATSTFAGPFGTDGRYIFYVPELPTHHDATVTLDVITFGNWTLLD
ncbi:MAG: hypothetical protein ACRELX_11395, partial [Longimicrobiales bacterium]